MSDDYQRIEIITGTARRRRSTTAEKLRIVEEALRSGESLAAAHEVLRQTPCSGAVFAFRGRRGDRLKLLYWDDQDF